jgi:predicted amidohydrolase YtcJ
MGGDAMSIRWDTRAPRPAGSGPPDLILRGGRILTGRVGDRPTFASALAVRGDRVLATGDDASVSSSAGAGTRVVDLGGRTVVPGLIDSHIHLVRGGLTWTDELRWFELPSLEAALGTIRAEVERTPAGTWIRAVGGWHGGQFREGRGPTREELTAVAPEHPVYVQLLYEEAVLNDAALQAAGIGATTPDPPLGAFLRDEDGTPTGTVRGIGAFNHVLGCAPPLDRDGQVASTAAMMRDLNRYGLTGVVDAGGLGMPPEAYEPLFQLWRDGGMSLRVRLYVCPLTRGDEEREVLDWMRFTRPGFGDGWLRHVGVGEIVHYGCHDLEGLTDFTVADGAEEALERTLLEVARRGWPLHLHSVLDDTTSTILGVFERVDRQAPIGGLRWSLAHVEPISTRNLDRIAALGVGIAVQDRLVYRAADSARVWGEDAVRGGPPLRDVLDRGIPLGAGTDATRVASPNPWVSLWWLVTGRTYDEGPERDPRQCLTRLEAIEAYTRGSAWFSVEEHERGTLTPGAAADLAVLDDDYFSVADEDIRRLGADVTVVAGRVVHAHGDYAGLEDGTST